jgi:hypothetical protein
MLNMWNTARGICVIVELYIISIALNLTDRVIKESFISSSEPKYLLYMLCAHVQLACIYTLKLPYRTLIHKSYCTSALSPKRTTPPMSASQPPWTKPTGSADEPILKIYNSLTRSKVWFKSRSCFDPM